MPGLKKFTNVTLKRGIIGDLAFWNWIVEAVSGLVRRTEGSVILPNENKQEVTR
jgi:phage tail-like protein